MSGFQILMQESFLAHQNFKSVWRAWRSGKLKDAKGVKPHTEPKTVTEARNLFLAKNDLLFSSKIEPLEIKFKKNPNALDEVIEFLSVDIPAFRCGYAKEVFLQRLKKSEFSKNESEKLQNLLIEVCKTKSFRREFRRWSRLGVKLADENFVEELKLLRKSENNFARIKSKWILETIGQNRLHLRDKINEY